MVRCQDIADIAGVSRQAVSAVLNGRGTAAVSAQTRDRILKIARELNYQPNESARSLARGCSRTVAFPYSPDTVLKLMRSPVYPRLIASLSTHFARKGYGFTLFPVEDIDNASQKLQMILSGRFDGIVCHVFYQKEELELFEKYKSRVVFFATTTALDATFADARIDGEPGIAELAEHFRCQGHTKIAYVGHKKDEKRLLQHLKIFSDCGVPISDKYIITGGNYRGNPGDSLVCFEETRKNWDILRQCTAVVFNNDYYALGGCSALRQLGAVPGRDIAVAGHDNLEECCEPFLTTTTAPYEILGERCVERLCAQLAGEEIFPAEKISNRLIIRQSTADFSYSEKKENE